MTIVDRPRPENQLFDNLFIERNRDKTLKAISQGLVSFVDNAGRLLEDANVLMKVEAFASSQFLITTANEEMAKSYILLDACRLDFSRHTSVLQRLCRAFYNHMTKYAYNQVIRFDDFYDMAHVKEVWDYATTKWWPAPDYESGEPDMPHETYFMRELPLYVDFIDYDQAWSKPENKNYLPDNWGNGFDEAQRAIEKLRQTKQTGLYTPQCLAFLNDTFRNLYVNEKTSSADIQQLYEKMAQQMEDKLGISKSFVFESALLEWPLYHFTTTK